MNNSNHQFNSQINNIISQLEQNNISAADIDNIKHRLNKLSDKYWHDNFQKNNIYKIPLAQGMIEYRSANYEEAIQFINKSIEIRGYSYEYADQVLRCINEDVGSTIKQNKISTIRFVGAMVLLLVLIIWIGFFVFQTIPAAINTLQEPSSISLEQKRDLIKDTGNNILWLDGAYESQQAGKKTGAIFSLLFDGASIVILIIFGPRLIKVLKSYIKQHSSTE